MHIRKHTVPKHLLLAAKDLALMSSSQRITEDVMLAKAFYALRVALTDAAVRANKEDKTLIGVMHDEPTKKYVEKVFADTEALHLIVERGSAFTRISPVIDLEAALRVRNYVHGEWVTIPEVTQPPEPCTCDGCTQNLKLRKEKSILDLAWERECLEESSRELGKAQAELYPQHAPDRAPRWARAMTKCADSAAVDTRFGKLEKGQITINGRTFMPGQKVRLNTGASRYAGKVGEVFGFSKTTTVHGKTLTYIHVDLSSVGGGRDNRIQPRLLEIVAQPGEEPLPEKPEETGLYTNEDAMLVGEKLVGWRVFALSDVLRPRHTTSSSFVRPPADAF